MTSTRELTDLQTKFLEALADRKNKGDVRRCMDIAGYNPDTSTSQVIKSLVDEVTEIASRHMASASIKASFALEDVLDGNVGINTKHILEASKQILDRAGVIKKEKENLELKIGSGLVILPAKDAPFDRSVFDK